MRSLIIAATIGLSGCSWVFMETVEDDYTPSEHGQPHCTGTEGFATWDMLLGVANLISGAMFVYYGIENEGQEAMAAYGGAGAAASIIHISSATSGFRNAERCREAREEFDALDL